MHPGWLSNAYVAWDEDSRDAFFVDSGAHVLAAQVGAIEHRQ